MRGRPVPFRVSENVRQRVLPRARRRSCERPVTAEPARVISVTHPWAWRIVTEPVTGVRGHPGLWLIDLPPRLSSGGNAQWLTWQSHPVPGTDP